LNISIALAEIDMMVALGNEKLDNNPKDKALKKELLANIDFIVSLLGFGGKEPFAYFQIGVDTQLKNQIDSLILARLEAKKAKDFALSDSIRDDILALGVAIMDTAQGTVWEKI